MSTAHRDRHRRAAEIFQRVCNSAPGERTPQVRALCAGDSDLYAEVMRLLEADASGPGPLDAPAVRVGLTMPDIEPETLPAQIGPFRIKALLGRGGMGVVYLAEQPGPRREVALKVLRAGMTSPKMLRRFEHEAEVLARLHHPGIAQVFEAGVHWPADASAEPRPYFAMEVIVGKPITEHAAVEALDLRARLELIAQVCDAVHHAHTKGVIHRDLKPGNVMVDAGNHPKVLDFGVARITQQTGEANLTLHTHAGQLIGTLQYMSPEQATGDRADIDTRSDVYSMGLILYELLAGRPAVEIPSFPIEEALRAIRDDDPARLSSIMPAYRGDVETIIAKAIHKDREQRYQSMADLAADIRRFLSDQPIEARPSSATYELRKFLKRNRGPVMGTTVICALMFVAIVTGGKLWVRAAKAEIAQRDAEVKQGAAERRQSEAERMQLETARREEELRAEARSIATTFSAALEDLASRAGNTLDFQQAIPKISVAFKQTAEMLADEGVLMDPALRSDFHRRLGSIFYYDLGLPKLALEQYLLALDLNKASTDEARREEDVKLTFFVGHTALAVERFEVAEAAYRQVVAFDRARPDRVPPLELAEALEHWSKALMALGRSDEAVHALTEATAIVRKERPPPSVELVEVLGELGDRLWRAKRDDEAAAAYTEALAQCRSLEREYPAISFKVLRYQAKLENGRGNHGEAERIQRDVLARSVALHGKFHRDVASAHVQLAGTLSWIGELDAAEEQLRLALESARGVPSPLPSNEATILNRLAEVLEKMPGRAEEATAAREEAAKILERVKGPAEEAKP